jgi:hypothetical protein
VWFKDVRVNNPEVQPQPAPHKSAPAAAEPAAAAPVAAEPAPGAAKAAAKSTVTHPPDVTPKAAPPDEAEDAVN